MEYQNRLVETKIEDAEEICSSLKEDIKRRARGGNLQTATEHVLDSIYEGTKCVQREIEKVKHGDDLRFLREHEAESAVHQIISEIQWLLDRLEETEHSDLADVPFEISSPLKKVIRSVFPSSDILIVTTSSLNYKIEDIASKIKERFSEKDKWDLPSNFPSKIFRVEFPSTSYKRAFLISNFAHEICHPLLYKYNILDDLLDFEADSSMVDEFTKVLRDEQDIQYSIDDLQLRDKVTRVVTESISSWVEEISSDLLALKVFGPSYFFSFLYFTPTTKKLDSDSLSHPPPRLRLRVLIRHLRDTLSVDDIPAPKTQRLISDWQSIAEKNLDLSDIGKIIYNSIEQSDSIDNIRTLVENRIEERLCYNDKNYRRDVEEITPLVTKQIPPVDIASGDGTSAINILNGGWESYICCFDEYIDIISGPDDHVDRIDASKDFNRFLLKSIELNDVKISWNNAAEKTL